MSHASVGAGELFALTMDPSSYVPSPARERALAQLDAALAAGVVPCLEGPTGIGKTLLFRVFGQRVAARFTPLYLPFPLLSARELCALAVGLLGRSGAVDPEAVLEGVAAELALNGRPLLLLLDDAASLPVDSARGLAAIVARSRGRLRVALAGIGGAPLLRATEPFGDALVRVALEEGVPDAALPSYVAAQLELAHAPANLREAFDDAALAELGRLAAGNPRRLHLAAQTIVRRAETALPAATTPAIPEAPPAAAPTGATQEPRVEAHVRPEAAEPAGEYRFVRGRLSAATGAPDTASEAATAQPILLPPAQIDLTLAALLEQAPRAAPAAKPDATPDTAARATRREDDRAPRAPRRAPSAVLVTFVAAISAVLGFALASQIERGRDGVRALVARIAPGLLAAPEPESTNPSSQIPAPPAQAPVPTPTAIAPQLAAPSPTTRVEPSGPEPVAQQIEVSINATPWARIEIDGEPVGETPLGGVPLRAGAHRFRALFPDGRVRERVVEIDAEQRTVVFE